MTRNRFNLRPRPGHLTKISDLKTDTTPEALWALTLELWQEILSDRGLVPSSILAPRQEHLLAPGWGHRCVMAWYTKEQAEDQIFQAQDDMLHCEGSYALRAMRNPGVMDTAHYLYLLRRRPEAQLAAMLCAIEHQRDPHHRLYVGAQCLPNPYERFICHIRNLALQALNAARPPEEARRCRQSALWSYPRRYTLPGDLQANTFRAGSYRGLLRTLLEEVLYQASEHCLVAFHLHEKISSEALGIDYLPALASLRHYEKEKERRDAAGAQRQAEMAPILEEQRRRKKEHMEAERRRAPWRELTRDDLERLVWSKPTSKLKQELGVSDSLITRRCREWSIPKPPRGFWRRVERGQQPHPNGKPTP